MLKYILLLLLTTSVLADDNITIYSGQGDLVYTDELSINGVKLENTMIDTGATYIMLPQTVLSMLDLVSVGTADMMLANGEITPADIYIVKEIKIGNCTASEIYVIGMESTFDEPVLGMEILVQFSPVTFDLTKNTITLTC